MERAGAVLKSPGVSERQVKKSNTYRKIYKEDFSQTVFLIFFPALFVTDSTLVQQ